MTITVARSDEFATTYVILAVQQLDSKSRIGHNSHDSDFDFVWLRDIRHSCPSRLLSPACLRNFSMLPAFSG